MKSRLRAFSAVAVLAAFFFASPVSAQRFHNEVVQSTSQSAGEVATYTIQFGNHFADHSVDHKLGSESRIRIRFPAGFDLTGARFDWDNSIKAGASSDTRTLIAMGGPIVPGPGAAVIIGNELILTPLNDTIIGTDHNGLGFRTLFKIIISDVRNPGTAGWYAHTVAFDLWNGSAWTNAITQDLMTLITVPPGVDLAADPARPLLYAEEIVASGTSPVTLLNRAGNLNLNFPLGYNFSAGEVRHVRMECSAGMRFLAGSGASYDGGGSAGVGAVNGLGTGAITFSVTANDNGVMAADYLTLTGTRAIIGTSAPVDCTYSLYDQASQAQAGGSAGRVTTLSGRYIDFGPSTAFTSTPRTSTVDVETSPRYTRFLSSAPTTNMTAGLARLTYGRTFTPGPLSPASMPISLDALHAAGVGGTRIEVDGDFSSAANADGSFTGDALSRVYLSNSTIDCSTVDLAAARLSATRATFNVGATARDRMLCLRPRAEVEIPASEYTARLEAVPSQPLLYRPESLGPLAAGSIVLDGVRLQAPLVQVLDGWISRIALTNTSGTPRGYAIRVMTESGVTLDTVNDEGTIPARGTKVIDLADVLRGSGQNIRGTIVVTVNGRNEQIQGLYQIVNPAKGTISNETMVRPGTN